MFDGSGPERLTALAEVLVRAVLTGGGVVEGVVTSMYRPPYRRLECDDRTLAYVHVRPKKNEVRVEVSGLWLIAERAPRLRVPARAGTIALVARDEAEIAEVAEFLKNTVARTREAFAKRR